MTEKFRSEAATHVGNVREHNEDCYRELPDLGLWIVADGMGGHECGEVASALTVDSIYRAIQSGKSLTDSLIEAHTAVTEAAKANPAQTGMGSTVVALTINGDRYEIAWVGDSRAYLYSHGCGFRQLSHDHSYVQLLLDNDLINPEDARNHPMSHVVNQAIGSSPTGSVKVDTSCGTFRPGDRFLLCTDGLTNELPDSQIAQVLEKTVDGKQAVELLIEEALQAGGSDNITSVVVDTFN